MKKIILMLISICLFNLSLMAQDKTLNEILEKYKGKEGISDIKALVDKGINAKDEYGATALMFAFSTDIAEVLIESGADINIKDSYGNTALMWASENRNTDIVKLLKAAGARE